MKFKIIGFVLGFLLFIPGMAGFEQLTRNNGYGVIIPALIFVAALFLNGSRNLKRKMIGRWLLLGSLASASVFIPIFFLTWGGKMC